jgi:hypothetical protein
MGNAILGKPLSRVSGLCSAGVPCLHTQSAPETHHCPLVMLLPPVLEWW